MANAAGLKARLQQYVDDTKADIDRVKENAKSEVLRLQANVDAAQSALKAWTKDVDAVIDFVQAAGIAVKDDAR